MIALDLFCGAGGASKGLLDAGFKRVIGVDNVEQKEYIRPKSFVCTDAIKYVSCNELENIDFIWASPPCQQYSWGTVKWRNKGKKYPDLVGITRSALEKTGKPFVIENVVGAPLRKDLMLCGEMFGLRIIRHRIFEIHGFDCKQPEHKKHKRHVYDGTACGVWMGGKPGCWGNQAMRKYYVTVAGHGGDGGKGNCSLKAWQEAMEIDWISNKKTLAQCVAPKYSEYIGKQYLKGVLNTADKQPCLSRNLEGGSPHSSHS